MWRRLFVIYFCYIINVTNNTLYMPTKILLLLLIICFLEGCSSERRKYISDREIKEIIINPEKTEDYLDISEVLSDSIDIIPLEVTENCLISDIKKLEFYKIEYSFQIE